MKKACVLFADGFEEVEAITPVDYLRRARIDVVTLGLEGQEIRGAHGITIRTDAELKARGGGSSSLSAFDCVVVPGGMPGAKNIAASHDATRIIGDVFNGGGLVAAICAAPVVVLSPLGFLKGRRFTCFQGMEKDAAGGIFSEERVVRDGNLITSRAAGCAAEFSVAVIRYLLGDGAAEAVQNSTLSR